MEIKREEITREHIIKTVLLERLLQVNKSALWNQILQQKLYDIEQVATNNKRQEHEKKQVRKDTIAMFNDKINRCEKYNCEINNYFMSIGKNVKIDDFADDCQDMFNDFLNQFLRIIDMIDGETRKVNIKQSFLIRDDNGNVEIEGLKYRVFI